MIIFSLLRREATPAPAMYFCNLSFFSVFIASGAAHDFMRTERVDFNRLLFAPQYAALLFDLYFLPVLYRTTPSYATFSCEVAPLQFVGL
jgi:hypothetical protein